MGDIVPQGDNSLFEIIYRTVQTVSTSAGSWLNVLRTVYDM